MAASAAYWAGAEAQAWTYWWTRSIRSARRSEAATQPSRQPGHRVGLRAGVDDDDVVRLGELHGRVMLAFEDDVLVDLVGDTEHVVFVGDPSELLHVGSSDWTAPVGFAGEQTTNAAVSSVIASSTASGLIVRSSRSPTGFGTPPARWVSAA